MNSLYQIKAEEIYSGLKEKITKVSRKELLYIFFKNVLLLFVFSLLIAFVLVLLESIFNFSQIARKIFFYGYVSVFSVSFVYIILQYIVGQPNLIKNFDLVGYSGKIGNAFLNIKDSLSNSLSLYNKFEKTNLFFSGELILANLEYTGENVQKTDLLSYISFKKLTGLIYILLAVITIFILSFIIFNQSLPLALDRILHYNTGLSGTQNTIAGNENDYPVIQNFTITINPPAFSRMPSQTLNENQGNIFCIEQSNILINLKSDRDLSSAGILLDSGFIKFDTEKNKATGSFKAVKDGKYRFFLKDTAGIENHDNVYYNIKVILNRAPLVYIIEPEPEIEIAKNLLVNIRTRITDDFGFSSLKLHYRKSNQNRAASVTYNSLEIPFENKVALSVEVPYLWNISSLAPKPGDIIEYYIEAIDNAGLSGKSDLRIIKYKYLYEIFNKSNQDIKDIEATLRAIYDDSKDLQKEIEELRKELNYTEELGINTPRMRQELQEKIENLQKNLESANTKISQTIEDLYKNNLISENTLQEYMKLQEQFNKLNTPEFIDMLKKLQEALQKNNTEQLKEELRSFQFDEEAFRKQLEQVMQLMKMIENLQKLGELTKKLDDIAKEQKNLKQQTEKADVNNEELMNKLANKQKDLKDALEKFKEDLKKLAEEIRKYDNEYNPEELQNLLKKLNEKNTVGKMEKSGKDLRKGDKEDSEELQDQIIDDLDELNNQMQEAFENSMSTKEKTEKQINKLKQIKKSLEELSEKQENLKEDTQDLEESDEQGFEENFKDQKHLQRGLAKNIDDLMNLSKEGMQISPQLGSELGKAYNNMDKAGENLKQGNKAKAQSAQQGAKESIDKAVQMLSDMISQMQQQNQEGKGSSRLSQLMQKLGQMIKFQEGVSGEISKLGKKGKEGVDGKEGTNYTQEQLDKIDKLKLHYEQIKKSLEELNDEFKKEEIRTGQKPLGDLEQIKKDVEDVIKDLSENNITEETAKKENKILSRLLDFQLSQREKDFEQKRESRPGENYERQSPPEIVIIGPQKFNAFKEDFLKLQKEGYAPDYELLIMKYLQLIKNL